VDLHIFVCALSSDLALVYLAGMVCSFFSSPLQLKTSIEWRPKDSEWQYRVREIIGQEIDRRRG
jgi:hypothetical protein